MIKFQNIQLLIIRNNFILDYKIIDILNIYSNQKAFIYFDSIVKLNNEEKLYEARPIWAPLLFKNVDYLGDIILCCKIELEAIYHYFKNPTTSELVKNYEEKTIIRIPNSGGEIKKKFKHFHTLIESKEQKNKLSKGKFKNKKLTVIVPTRFKKAKTYTLIEELLKSIEIFTDKDQISEIILLYHVRNTKSFNKIKKKFINELNIIGIQYTFKFNFSKVINLGISKSLNNYILILNDDVYFSNLVDLSHSINHLDKDSIDIIGFYLLYPNSNLIQHGGIEFKNKEPQHFLKGTSIVKLRQYGNTCREVSGVTGAAMLISKNLICEHGPFDEQLPNDYGDIEMMLRVGRSSGKIAICSKNIFYHHESITRGKTPVAELRKNLKYIKNKYGELPIRDAYLYTPISIYLDGD